MPTETAEAVRAARMNSKQVKTLLPGKARRAIREKD